MISGAKIPTTVITGFLGAGKTTLVRHVLENAGGRRVAVIVNEFGSLGIDGQILKGCGIESCGEEDIVELANGCLCCTVADDFVPSMETLVERDNPPEHILIETSGLALPKPLLKAFDWPSIRSRLTVDGVIAVVDGPAVAEGRFADDPEQVERQRQADESLDHDNPLQEVFEDQLSAADLVIVNKSDLLTGSSRDWVLNEVETRLPRAVKVVTTEEGVVDPSVLLGLGATAEDDLDDRPSHHDGLDDHEHDDFDSFIVELPEQPAAEALLARLQQTVEVHDILRVKGFLAVSGKPMRLLLHGVGARFRHHYDRLWQAEEARSSRLVIIGHSGMDRDAIVTALAG
ncbi:MAG: cobalamin biosynthesis protein CobW [Rhodospirillales bacterium]|nr:cobalamin biosynthesis protein CobW [Rhodospirillales bacterium]